MLFVACVQCLSPVRFKYDYASIYDCVKSNSMIVLQIMGILSWFVVGILNVKCDRHFP